MTIELLKSGEYYKVISEMSVLYFYLIKAPKFDIADIGKYHYCGGEELKYIKLCDGGNAEMGVSDSLKNFFIGEDFLDVNYGRIPQEYFDKKWTEVDQVLCKIKNLYEEETCTQSKISYIREPLPF